MFFSSYSFVASNFSVTAWKLLSSPQIFNPFITKLWHFSQKTNDNHPITVHSFHIQVNEKCHFLPTSSLQHWIWPLNDRTRWIETWNSQSSNSILKEMMGLLIVRTRQAFIICIGSVLKIAYSFKRVEKYFGGKVPNVKRIMKFIHFLSCVCHKFLLHIHAFEKITKTREITLTSSAETTPQTLTNKQQEAIKLVHSFTYG